MFNIYLRGGVKTFRHANEHKDVDLDIDYDEEKPNQLDAFVGENGIGKSFLCQNVVYLAFLYKMKGEARDGYYKADIQKIIARLAVSKIGDFGYISEIPKSEPGKRIISMFTSYNPNKVIGNEVNDMVKSQKWCYFFSISDRTQKIFDNWNFLYYSNSQFPSNEIFFSKCCSSLQVSNIDLIFWRIKQNNYEGLKVSYWINKSLYKLYPTWEINEKNFLERTKNWTEYWRKFYYKNKHIFAFLEKDYSNFSPKNIIESDIFKKILELNKTPFISPKDEKKLDEISLDEYIVYLTLKDLFNTFDYELLVPVDTEYIPYKLLNSGKKYELLLSVLGKLYRKNLVLFVDEPENSLHMKVQDKIAKNTLQECKLNLVTHSPAFISSLIRDDDCTATIHLLHQSGKECLIESSNRFGVNRLSLDFISAEFLGYSPFLDTMLKLEEIDSDNMISINDFYEEIQK
jgi:predicted ATPase